MTRRGHTAALAVSLAWMALVFAAVSLAADMGEVSRLAALVQWLSAGVLPPALALASMDPAR